MDIIKIKNLNFSYGSKKIFQGINLNFKKNRLIGILGPNGCGKSTLLKNILGYLQSESGDIYIDEILTLTLSQKEKAKLISLVPQKSQLISAMTVEEFVLLGRLPHLQNSWSGYSRKDIEISQYHIKKLNLEKFLHRKAITLSGGEFQRVLLARALTQETKVILLDEPTSALDLNHALDLMQNIRNNIIENGLTAIAVLHDLNLAAMFCDEIVMLKDGKVHTQGTPKEVLIRENLKAVYDLEAEVCYTDNNIPYIIPKLKGGK